MCTCLNKLEMTIFLTKYQEMSAVQVFLYNLNRGITLFSYNLSKSDRSWINIFFLNEICSSSLTNRDGTQDAQKYVASQMMDGARFSLLRSKTARKYILTAHFQHS